LSKVFVYQLEGYFINYEDKILQRETLLELGALGVGIRLLRFNQGFLKLGLDIQKRRRKRC
jgi:hypothetical protein